MKAVRFHTIGSPEVLRVDDVDKPKPGPGQVLVKVHVVGVNFADTLLRRGTYISQPNLPETPGYEARRSAIGILTAEHCMHRTPGVIVLTVKI